MTLEKRREQAGIGCIEELTIEQIKRNTKEAEDEWQEIKIKGKEYHENELLDYNEIEVSNIMEKEKQIRKKILQRIKKERYRLHAFHFLTKHVKKGITGSLKRLHEEDNEGNINKTYNKREDIEE